MKSITIYLKDCIGCGACVEVCPMKAIPPSLIGYISGLAEIDKEKCNYCGECVRICPYNAIQILEKAN
jgi:ferredoxin